MSHTFAELEVSLETYNEIKKLLEKAGYHHAFVDGAIDMHGIGLVKPKLPDTVCIMVNGDIAEIDTTTGKTKIDYDDVFKIAYPDLDIRMMTCTYGTKDGRKSGIFYAGDKIDLEEGLRFTIMDTGNA